MNAPSTRPAAELAISKSLFVHYFTPRINARGPGGSLLLPPGGSSYLMCVQMTTLEHLTMAPKEASEFLILAKLVFYPQLEGESGYEGSSSCTP